ncbi:beta-class carbonic anhydrase [Paenibacillus thermotolerans]|uniref:beta-class carbonic anhydrase n=1 Tax=Paenibacillus thermotolerans TaxID=3027807 RepID=UPI00236846B8|nr:MULTISPECIES: carbonic anhydrase [unclassified Paenibacillus]
MNRLETILTYNEKFVSEKGYEQFVTDKFPDKQIVVLTCMDTRLIDLLPRAMNLKNGDAKIIRNAGAIVVQPFGNIMRSILVALYELNAEEVFVVGHYDCGMTGLNADNIIRKAEKRGVAPGTIDTLRHSGIDLPRWLTGFDDVTQGVQKSVEIIRNHPLLPENTPVHGLVIDPTTGRLDMLVNGYES